jgi:hypothetical protein
MIVTCNTRSKAGLAELNDATCLDASGFARPRRFSNAEAVWKISFDQVAGHAGNLLMLAGEFEWRESCLTGCMIESAELPNLD